MQSLVLNTFTVTGDPASIIAILLELAVRASDLGGIQSAVAKALERTGLTWDGFVEDIQPGFLMSFMDDLPTRYVTNVMPHHVTNVMRSAKPRQAEQRLEPNDFNDILALPVAAVLRCCRHGEAVGS